MKKIISLLAITTIVFSMVASLNIMSVSADSTNLYDFKFFDVETKKIYFNEINSVPGSLAFYLRVCYNTTK